MRHEPNVLFITCEEMKQDHAGSVRRIAELMGVDKRYIDDYCRAELKRLGCDFPYDQAFGLAAPHAR